MGSSRKSLGRPTTLYHGRIRPSRPSGCAPERRLPRPDARLSPARASAPWRCGARPPTKWLGRTADGSPYGHLIHEKGCVAAPSGVGGRRRLFAPLLAPRPGVTSAANNADLRSQTARHRSLQGGHEALGSGGSLHAAPVPTRVDGARGRATTARYWCCAPRQVQNEHAARLLEAQPGRSARNLECGAMIHRGVEQKVVGPASF